MRTRHWIGLALPLALGAGCATTSVDATWKDPSAVPVGNVLVVPLSGKDGIRRTVEDALVRELRSKGVRAEGLSTRLPELGHRRISEVTRDDVRGLVEREGFDAVLAVQLVDKETVVEHVMGAPDFYGYWDAAFPMTYTPGYIEESTEYRIESRLFETSGGAHLAWTVTTSSFDPNTANALIDEIGSLVVERLGKDGLLRKSATPSSRARRGPTAVVPS